MYPTLFTFSQSHGLSLGLAHAHDPGVVGFHAWGMMVMLAFLAAFLTTSARAPRVGIDSDSLVPLYLIISLCGMAGSRLLHFLFAEPALFLANPLVFFDMGEGGFAFLGGVIGGVLSGAAYAVWRGIPVWKLADVAAPSIMLALAVGRVGCFLAGCCHGGACAGAAAEVTATLLALPGGSVVLVEGAPWLALIFNAGVGVGAIHGVPLYPTQLWEIATGLTLFVVLSALWRWGRRFDGQILATLMVLYSGARITIEGFRGDVVRGVDQLGSGLSTSQVVSLVLVGLAVLIVLLRARQGVAPEVPFREPEEADGEPNGAEGEGQGPDEGKGKVGGG